MADGDTTQTTTTADTTGTGKTADTGTTQQQASQQTAAADTTKGADAKSTSTSADTTKTTTTPATDTTKTGDTAQTQQTATFAWPENWRQQIAGEDKTLLTQLERFTDPSAIFKQNRELQAKLSSGKVKYDLPENATEEQKAQYRKDNGLPDTAEGYEVKLPDGIVVGEADKPLVAEYQKFAHATNMSPADFNKTLGFYYQLQAQQAKAQAEADVAFHDQSVSMLTQDFGGEAQFKRNTNIIGNLMATVPADVADSMLSARTPDGRMLGDNPLFNKWLVEMGRALNPSATLMPNSNNPPAAVNSRVKEIEGMMYINGQANPAYWGNEALQKELRDLYTAQGQEKARGAA